MTTEANVMEIEIFAKAKTFLPYIIPHIIDNEGADVILKQECN